MTTIFKYVPHPHIEERKASAPPKIAAAVAEVLCRRRADRFEVRSPPRET
jgi:hypothetical protein